MNGSRAKAKRRGRSNRPLHLANAGLVLESASAVLKVDLSDVPLSRVNQFTIGWMRAAFEQCRIIAKLASEGLGYASAPNRRTLWELTLRLLWLSNLSQPSREPAVDAMLAQMLETEKSTDNQMREMGLDYLAGINTMDEFALDPSTDKQLLQQAKNLTAAAKATGINSGVIYKLWRDDSTWSHATGYLAGFFAPENGSTVGDGTPPTVDPNLEALRPTAFLLTLITASVLTDEGVAKELASAPCEAFAMVDPKHLFDFGHLFQVPPNAPPS